MRILNIRHVISKSCDTFHKEILFRIRLLYLLLIRNMVTINVVGTGYEDEVRGGAEVLAVPIAGVPGVLRGRSASSGRGRAGGCSALLAEALLRVLGPHQRPARRVLVQELLSALQLYGQDRQVRPPSHTYIPLTLYPRRSSRGISNIPPKHVLLK
jgi:hypothetical protein